MQEAEIQPFLSVPTLLLTDAKGVEIRKNHLVVKKAACLFGPSYKMSWLIGVLRSHGLVFLRKSNFWGPIVSIV